MSKLTEDQLPSIDISALSTVTGGAHKAGHNDQVTAALTSITESLKSIGKQNTNNSSSSLSQMLPLLMLAKGGAGGGCPGGNCGR